jgi:hypothetical protein
MKDAWERLEMRTECSSRNLKVRGHLIDPGINGIFTLQWILKEHDKRVLNAFT